MARLDVHPMPGDAREDEVRDGYVVDMQAGLLSHLATRTVLPLLLERTAPKPISELNPVFDIDGERYVLVTQAIASVPGRELQRPVGSLAKHHDSITRALDILLVGF